MKMMHPFRAACSAATITFVVLLLATAGKAPAQTPERSPEVDMQIINTVKEINGAFMRGDIRTLLGYMDKGVTMLHGSERINNVAEAREEWQSLFAMRKKLGLSYSLRTRDMKIQQHGDIAIVTFSYLHPRVVGTRITSEGGKAVYILLNKGGKWVMVHCSVVRDIGGFKPLQ